MNFETFINQLSNICEPGDFVLIDGRTIRSTALNQYGKPYCPICWLARRRGLNDIDTALAPLSQSWFKMDSKTTTSIMNAADVQTYSDTRLRLLQACKLAS